MVSTRKADRLLSRNERSSSSASYFENVDDQDQDNKQSNLESHKSIHPRHILQHILENTSLSLENKGAVARDHMANERTFLAWLRTSLSFITIGIGVTQLFRIEDKSANAKLDGTTILFNTKADFSIHKFGKPLGGTFIILGICTLLLGLFRFFQVQVMLTKNYYPASRLSIFLLILIVLVIIVITLFMTLKATG